MTRKFIRSLIKRVWFTTAYLLDPPWDTGIPAPELVDFVSARVAGNALDLGCGSGTNVVYLAQQGWRVDGVDFSPLAVRQARRKTSRLPADEHLDVNLLVGDVSRLEELELRAPFELVLDIGCMHALGDESLVRSYARGVKRVIKPGGTYLLYAHQPKQEQEGYPDHGITKAWVEALFLPDFELLDYQPGFDGPRGSAWFWLRRRSNT